MKQRGVRSAGRHSVSLTTRLNEGDANNPLSQSSRIFRTRGDASHLGRDRVFARCNDILLSLLGVHAAGFIGNASNG